MHNTLNIEHTTRFKLKICIFVSTKRKINKQMTYKSTKIGVAILKQQNVQK
jgi:hypothetical protein